MATAFVHAGGLTGPSPVHGVRVFRMQRFATSGVANQDNNGASATVMFEKEHIIMFQIDLAVMELTE
jgi:hypothetical protein